MSHRLESDKLPDRRRYLNIMILMMSELNVVITEIVRRSSDVFVNQTVVITVDTLVGMMTKGMVKFTGSSLFLLARQLDRLLFTAGR